MSNDFLNPQQLSEKWNPILEHADLPKIDSAYKRHCTAVLLENQERALREEKQSLMEAPGSTTGNVANYDPVLIGLVRRAVPQLIAYDVCGVQPMTMPSGLVFALQSQYVDNATVSSRTEALFNEANPGWSGDAAAAANSYNGGVTALTGSEGSSPVTNNSGVGSPWGTAATNWNTGAMATSNAEKLTPQEMSFRIIKSTVTANSRALKAEYTVELAQDLKAVHGLDAEAELSNILSNEILAEINREVIRRIYFIAKNGAQETTTAGTFDLDVDANGRWSVERFKGLMFQIEREANRVAQTTRRGRANFIICSADVASALAMAGKLDIGGLGQNPSLNVDESSTTFAGVLNGKYKVYVDPYMATVAGSSINDNFCLVGYKGNSPFDAGMFYCPYVPLSLMRAVDPATFQPKIGFKTRYGLIGHPLARSDDVNANNTSSSSLGANTNYYYRLMRVANIA